MSAICGPLRDRHGRTIDYLRLSITDRCNFRCPFCVPAGVANASDGKPRLDIGETLRLCGILGRLGVTSVKVTGGEPFMRPDAVAIVAGLKTVSRIRRVTVTTNGSTLARHARELADAGVDGVNVSLNALSPDIYAETTGGAGDPGRVLEGIALARELGLGVKVNMVPLRGVNLAEIVPLVEFAVGMGVPIKFIELMPIGAGRGREGLSMQETRRLVEERFGPLEAVADDLGDGPAVYYGIRGKSARIGFIAAVSQRFCGSCNRIRLASTGFLRTCLHHEHGVDLLSRLRAGDDDGQIAWSIARAVADKPERHCFGDADSGLGGVPMLEIGG